MESKKNSGTFGGTYVVQATNENDANIEEINGFSDPTKIANVSSSKFSALSGSGGRVDI